MIIRYLSYIYRSLFSTGALVLTVASLDCRRPRRVAKYDKCGGTLAYLSNLGNKDPAKVLTVATHLCFRASEQRSMFTAYIDHVTNTNFARDQHD